MSADEELERAKTRAIEKMKVSLARRIIKISEEDFLPSNLKSYVRVLKVICIIAVFICGPIMGWLITEMSRGALSLNLFIVYLFPMIFLGIITAIALAMKVPE